MLAELRLAVLQVPQGPDCLAQILLGVQALALDSGGERFIPAQLRVEVFGGSGERRDVRLALTHERSRIQPSEATAKKPDQAAASG